METNLEKYAAEMSRKIKDSGLDCYHWSEVSTVIDELLKYADFGAKNVTPELRFVGYTNGANIKMVKEADFGAMYSDTKQECYIPLYMLHAHLHRIESTSNGSITAADLGMDKP